MKFSELLKLKINSRTFNQFLLPLKSILKYTPELGSRGNRPLKLNFEDQLNALIYFHLQELDSCRGLVQNLAENEFAKQNIAPKEGISLSSFSEAINSRGLEQLKFVFNELSKKASKLLPAQFKALGDLVAIDGSLIDACMTMYWADYKTNSKKAKGHFGFNINQGIPSKIYLTDGNGAERPFVSTILSSGQTGIMDRGYQCHNDFDRLQEEGKSFVCRIRASTTMKELNKVSIPSNESFIFMDSKVFLGTKNVNQTKIAVRLVGYLIEDTKYYIATDRFDITAEQVAEIYKLRWNIESFFKWWKKHLKVYHLIARSEYGVMTQVLGGLISYLLMAIYCHEMFNEKVTIHRVRSLRIAISNDLSRKIEPLDSIIFFKEYLVPYAQP